MCVSRGATAAAAAKLPMLKNRKKIAYKMDYMDHFGEILSLLAKKLKIFLQGIQFPETRVAFK